jgi:hypothetical protein
MAIYTQPRHVQSPGHVVGLSLSSTLDYSFGAVEVCWREDGRSSSGATKDKTPSTSIKLTLRLGILFVLSSIVRFRV